VATRAVNSRVIVKKLGLYRFLKTLKILHRILSNSSADVLSGIWDQSGISSFLPRCMECRRGLTMRILSDCLSVKRVHCHKMKEKSVQIFTTMRKIIYPSFLRESDWWGETPST